MSILPCTRQAAEAIELCLFDASGQQGQCFRLPGNQDGVWSGYLPGCEPGQRYGYRAHGPWAPESGLRFNPSKLLIDPYAQALEGSFQWAGAVYDFDHSTTGESIQPNRTDSAAFIPKCIVMGPAAELRGRPPAYSLVGDHHLRSQRAWLHHAAPGYTGE